MNFHVYLKYFLILNSNLTPSTDKTFSNLKNRCNIKTREYLDMSTVKFSLTYLF